VHRPRHRPGRRPPRQPRREPPDPASIEKIGVVLDFMPVGNRKDPHKHHQREPVVQAVGFNYFTLLDGIPLNFSEIDFLEKVALLSEVYKTIIYPDQRRGVGRASVFLACLRERDSAICFPVTPLDQRDLELLAESFEEKQRVTIVDDFDKFERIITEKGLPTQAIRVPPTPIRYSDLTPTAKSNLEQAVSSIVKEREKDFVEFFNIAEPINVRLHAIELLPGVGKKTLKKILQYRLQKRFASYEEIHKVAKIDPVSSLTEKIIEELRGDASYYLFVRPPDPGKPFLGYLNAISKLRRAGRGHAMSRSGF